MPDGKKEYVNLPDDVVHATVDESTYLFGNLTGTAYESTATNDEGEQGTGYGNDEGEALANAVKKVSSDDEAEDDDEED